jgi:hypothetical protein
MRLLAGEIGDDTQVRFESHAPAASASPRSKQWRRRRGLAHRERSLGWVTIMPMTGVPHVHGPARHEPGIVTCLRSAMLLAGGVAAGPSSGRCSTPPGSSGCSVRVAPRTGPARAERLGQLRRTRPGGTSEPFSRQAAPRVADGRRHRPRRSWRPCSARSLSRPNPKHGQVRFDAPASRRRDRSRDPSVSIPCTSAPPNDAFCTPELKDVEVRVDLPNGGYWS